MGSSTQVVPTTSNTQQSVQIPEYLQDAGKSAIAKANDIASTPFQSYSGQMVAPESANQQAASAAAGQSGGVGAGDNAVAQGALGAAAGTAVAGHGAGTGALNGAGTLLGAQGANAMGSVNAGKNSADLAAALASIGGGSAVNSQGAGASDLAQARSYNAASAGAITPDMINSYMNPYIQQAIDPVVAQLSKAAGTNRANIDSKAAMSGSFGGARSGLEEAQNQADLTNSIAGVTGTGYLDAFNNAQSQAQAQLARQQAAAGTSLNIASGANTEANDTLSRLTQASGANDSAATTQSDLASAAGSRLGAAATGQIALGQAQSQLSTEDVNRLLSLISPANATGAASSQLTTDYLNRLLTTGAVDQTQSQNQDNAAYQQFQNQVNYPQVQLNALLAAAGGVPYGTTSTSNTQGTQVVQSASPFGQIAGLGIAAAGAFSNRDWKTDFEAVDDEDILQKFRNLTVETYRYKPELRAAMGDDGRERIGPMAQDWAKEFGGDGKIIPMPEILGGLISAVRALEARTSNDEGAFAA